MIDRLRAEQARAADETARLTRELDAMKAELRRLRLAEGREVALARIKAFGGPDTGGRMYTAEELAEAWKVGE